MRKSEIRVTKQWDSFHVSKIVRCESMMCNNLLERNHRSNAFKNDLLPNFVEATVSFFACVLKNTFRYMFNLFRTECIFNILQSCSLDWTHSRQRVLPIVFHTHLIPQALQRGVPSSASLHRGVFLVQHDAHVLDAAGTNTQHCVSRRSGTLWQN